MDSHSTHEIGPATRSWSIWASTYVPDLDTSWATRQPSLKPENTRATTHGNRRRVATRDAAEADVILLVAFGQPIPSQDTLAARWDVHKGTASKWLRDFECRGIIRRSVVGRCKMVASA
jgi:hypothetical protein